MVVVGEDRGARSGAARGEELSTLALDSTLDPVERREKREEGSAPITTNRRDDGILKALFLFLLFLHT